MTYFLLVIIIIQSVVIGLFTKFTLKHFTLTIEDIDELTVKQAKSNVDEFLKGVEGEIE